MIPEWTRHLTVRATTKLRSFNFCKKTPYTRHDWRFSARHATDQCIHSFHPTSARKVAAKFIICSLWRNKVYPLILKRSSELYSRGTRFGTNDPAITETGFLPINIKEKFRISWEYLVCKIYDSSRSSRINIE